MTNIFTFNHITLIQVGFFIMLTVSIIQLSQYLTVKSEKTVKDLFLGNVIYALFFLTVSVDIAFKSLSFPVLVAALDLGAVIFWAMSFNASMSKKQPHKLYLGLALANLIIAYLIFEVSGDFILIRGITTLLIALIMSNVLFAIIQSKAMRSLNSFKTTVLSLSVFILLKLGLVYSRLVAIPNGFNLFDRNLSMTFFTFFSLALAIWINFTITYIDLETKNKQLRKISLVDHLTDLPNRRSIESKLQDLIQLHIRDKINFFVILIDIDDFKKVNDTYGHDYGDQVLIELGQILKDNIRTIDQVGRYGGEEFVLVVVDEEKESFCKRLLESISHHQFTQKNIHITISGGLVAIKSNDKYLALKDIISQADKNLYKAKEEGKNRIVE